MSWRSRSDILKSLWVVVGELERVDSGGDGKVALETRSLLALVCST
jgi:hypothetical protein